MRVSGIWITLFIAKCVSRIVRDHKNCFLICTSESCRISYPLVLALAIVLLIAWYVMFGVTRPPIVLPLVGELSTGQELAISFVGDGMCISAIV